MSPQELAAIVERAAEADPYECEYCHEYGPAPAEADRRALLALLRETREALDSYADGVFWERGERPNPVSDPLIALLAALGPP